MNVSACLVTRGNVEMQPVIDSLPPEWEIVIWDNGEQMIHRSDGYAEVCTDLSVYGRYAAIEHASHDLIYVVDDDVIVSDPQAIVDTLLGAFRCRWCGYCEGNRQTWCNCGCGRDYNEMIPMHNEAVVCNMPQEFRPHYPDSAMVGFGAAFHRDAPRRAFDKWIRHWKAESLERFLNDPRNNKGTFLRRADNIFTTLTPRVMVDVPKIDREMASDPLRMWKQPGHEDEKQRMIELARQVRDSV